MGRTERRDDEALSCRVLTVLAVQVGSQLLLKIYEVTSSAICSDASEGDERRSEVFSGHSSDKLVATGAYTDVCQV